MYGLTVWQPWAGLIVAGHKPVENRRWETSYRGPLAIYAGLKDEPLGRQILRDFGLSYVDTSGRGIIGLVDVVDVVERHGSPWAEPGCKHWVLANPRRLAKPVPYRGMPGLWPVPGGLAERLLAAELV